MESSLEDQLGLFFAEHDFVLHGKLFDDLVVFINERVDKAVNGTLCVEKGYSTLHG